MKKRMKMLAFLLATAVTVTSVPCQNVVLAETKEVKETNDFSAYEAAIAQFALGTESVSKDAPTAVKGIYWNSGYEEEPTEYTYSDDLRTKRKESVFKGNSILEASSLRVSTYEELSYDKTTLLEKLGYNIANTSIEGINYNIQWYSIGQDGTVKEESTDSYIYPEFASSDIKKTYICQINIESLSVYDDENWESYTVTASDLEAKGILTAVNKIFSFEYVEDESSKVLMSYNTGWMSDEEKKKLSKNDTVYTEEYEYDRAYESNSLYSRDITTQDKNLYRIFGIPATSLETEIEYLWYQEDAQGNRTQVLDENGQAVTGNYYSPSVYAKDGNVTYVCVQTLKKISYSVYDEENDKFVEKSIELNDTTLPAGCSNKVESVYKFKYTGLTKEDFEADSTKISEYFNGIENLQDKTFNFESFDSTEYYDAENLYVKDDEYASMKQTWTAYFTDGTSKICRTSTSDYGNEYSVRTYEDVYETEESEDSTRKYVDHYVLQAELMYNGIVIDTISKNVKVSFEPFSLHNEGTQTVSVRNNGKYTFAADAEINDSGICTGLKYQWYSIDKEGKETSLEEETDTTLKRKITDPSVIYKCKVTGVMSEDYTGPAVVKEVSFSIKTSSGYRLFNRPSSYISKKIGEDLTFSVEASVDDGYSLKYKWERYDGTDEAGKQKITELGTDASYKISSLKEEDFGSNYDSTVEDWWRYRVTVSVCKNGETEPVETYVYYSTLNNESENFDINCESYEKTVYKGEDANLRVIYSQKEGFTIEPQWYEAVAVTKGSFSDEGGFVSSDPTFKAPEYDELCDNYTDDTDENGNTIYERIYYKKVVPKDALILSEDKKTLTVKDAANPGKYLCCVNIFKNSEMDKKEEERNCYNRYFLEMSVKEKTDLVAYMKSGKNMEAVQGENAGFVVNAANFNVTACPITYVWEKYNDEKQVYEKIADAGTNRLNFEKVKAEDFGEYRVTVKDAAEEIVLNLSLTEKLKDVVIQSPYYAKFTPKMGETVTLKAESNLTAQDKVFYEWYRMEATYGDDNGYWELINQDTDTYTFDVKNDKDYTTYKCIVSYKSGGTNYEKNFIYRVQNSQSFSLENTTLERQYKKMGDSATYGVRALYKDTEFSENNLMYEWYRIDSYGEYQKIEGATGNTYQISALKPEDFGTIYCLVKDKVSGASQEISFETLLYTESYLLTDDETVYGNVGSNITLQPEIVQPEAGGYTYQWYCYGEEEENGYWDEEWNDDTEDWEEVYHTYYSYGEKNILYGATSEKLEITDLMAGDFTKYECVISYNGMKVMTYNVRLAKNTSEAENIQVKSKTQRVKAAVKQRADLKVEATSLDGTELRYQWYKGYVYDEDGETEEMLAIGNAVKDTLSIEQVTPQDYGTYLCKVSDKNGNSVTVRVYLSRTTNMNVSTDSYNTDDTVGYATSFGGTVTLKATASVLEGETLFYQWYKDGKKLYGENGATLTITNVTKEELGNYKCYVSDVCENEETLYYLVYVDTGLNAVQSVSDVAEASDGSAVMYVEAVANAGETISYQWSKWDDEKDAYVEIAGADSSQYKLPKVNMKDYGEYRCVVSTVGESYQYNFELYPEYYATVNRSYAQTGDTVTVSAKIENPAADADYTYQWYAEDPKTGTYMLTDCTSATYSTKAPSVNIGSDGYKTVSYRCVITNGTEKHTSDSQVNVLRKMSKNTSSLPETARPFSKTYDVQNYSIPNAKALDIVFEAGSDIPAIIDSTGNIVYYYNGKYSYRVTGDTVIFLYQNNSGTGAGYKVESIKAVVEATPTVTEKPTATPAVTEKPTPTPDNIKKATPTPKAGSKTTAPGKPVLKSVVNVKGKKMTVKISKKVKGAAGYQITYATNATFKKNKKNVEMTSTTKTIKSLKKGTTYYVKVRAYAKDRKGKKIYGAYSKVKKVTIKK